MPEANPKSEECMMEEEKHNTEGEGEGEEERVLEIERMSGSLNRKEGSQSVRNQVRKTRSQKESVKKISDEEDRKTVMLMENRKRKGRLGSGAELLGSRLLRAS